MPSRPPRPCNHPGCPALTRERYCTQHAAAHVERERARLAARPSAAQRGYGREWQAIRSDHLMREPYCRACGAEGRDVDHILPRSQGGSDHHSNLQTLCINCHRKKTRNESMRVRAREEVMA